METGFFELEVRGLPNGELKLRRTNSETVLIGSGEHCDVFINDESIAATEARLTFKGDDAVVEPLEQQNGKMLIDGNIVSSPTTFSQGQRLTIAFAVLMWRQLPPSEWPTIQSPESEPRRESSNDEELRKARAARERLKQKQTRVRSRVGVGGQGLVVETEESPLQRNVAMKVILATARTSNGRKRLSEEERLRNEERLIQEAQVTGYLQHPAIVPIHDLSVDAKGRVFYTMKRVKGKTLHECLVKLPKEKNYDLASVLTIFQKICDAVAFAHAQTPPIVHRDLKPENVMVGDYGEVLVMDWGLAKVLVSSNAQSNPNQPISGINWETPRFVSSPNSIVGTPGYMAPEQARGELVDQRSDIYSLGAILYSILTLAWPGPAPDSKAGKATQLLPPGSDCSDKEAQTFFEEQTPKLKQRIKPDLLPHVPNGRIPESLAAVVRKAMAPRPKHRFSSVQELQTELTRYQSGRATAAEEASTWKLLNLFVKRHKGVSLSVAAFLALIIGITSIYIAVLLHQQRVMRENFSRSDFFEAIHRIDQQRTFEGLAFLSRALSLDRNNQAACYRLATLLSHRNYAIPLFSLPHVSKVSSARYSPDGRRIVTGCYDDSVRVWDAETGEVLTNPMKHEKFGWVRFSSDSKRIMTASSDGSVRIWDAETGQMLSEPIKQHGSFGKVQFSPDGTKILESSSYEIQVWDAETGKALKPVKNVGIPISSLGFSPDSKRFVTSDFHPDLVRIWDAQTGDIVSELGVSSIQYSPDGTKILANSKNEWQVWDAETEEALTRSISVRWAKFSPDGKRLVGISNEDIRILDAENLEEVTEPIKVHFFDEVEFSPDGKQIMVILSEENAVRNTVRIWDAETGTAKFEPLRHNAPVRSAEFKPDGKRMITVSENTVRIWDVENGTPLFEPLRHDASHPTKPIDPRIPINVRGWYFGGGEVTCAHFSPNNKRIVTASADGTARVWDADTGKPLTQPMKGNAEVFSVEFSRDGKRIVTTSCDSSERLLALQCRDSPENIQGDSSAQVWDAETGNPLSKPMKHSLAVLSAKFSPDGRRVLTSSKDKSAQIWDVETGTPIGDSMKHNDCVLDARFSPDGKWIVTASEDGAARVWDGQNGRPWISILAKCIASAQFSPEGKRILTAGSCKAQIWDAQTGEPIARPMEHGGNPVSRRFLAQFSPDGKRILTCGGNTARIWDASDGRALADPIRQDEEITVGNFSADGKWIVIASSNGSVQVWDAESGKPVSGVMKHVGRVLDARFSPDGKRIVTACGPAAWTWDMVPTDAFPTWLPRLAELIAGERLNESGVFQPLTEDTAKMLTQLKDQLSHEPGDNSWATWGRWFLADRSMRTISPFSKETIAEYIENRIKENTPESLDEAETLAIGNPQVLQRIAEARGERKK